jgi:hypothetical protein
MQPMKVMPGDVVIQEGQRGREMYIIKQGEVEVSQTYEERAEEGEGEGEGGLVVRRRKLGYLREGAFFGELPLIGLGLGDQVRKTPSWPRSWANFSFLYYHRNAWADSHRLGQPSTFLAPGRRAGAHGGGGVGVRPRLPHQAGRRRAARRAPAGPSTS